MKTFLHSIFDLTATMVVWFETKFILVVVSTIFFFYFIFFFECVLQVIIMDTMLAVLLCWIVCSSFCFVVFCLCRNPGSGEAVVPQPNASTVELEHRVRTLEDKVQQLTETLQSQGGQVGGVSNFWYVVTFTGWMLAPLVAIFAYRFKH